jgi:nucleoside-diphosphate kinase
MERTFSIVKPDGVRQGNIGDVISRFEKNGLKPVAVRMLTMTKKDAEGFYAVHHERPFFDELTTFMSSGPIVVMCLEGDNAITKVRDIMGATNPSDAAAGTLRADFAKSIGENVVHGSDAPETAKAEIGYFFNGLTLSTPCLA